MNVVLIYPRMLKDQTLETNYPLGILYLATFLNKNGIKTHVIDMSYKNIKQMNKILLKLNPDVVGVNLTTPFLNDSIRVINAVREVLPKATILGGGSHVSADPKGSLKLVDYVLEGEAELSTLALLKNTKKNKEHLIKSQLCKDLDTLPFPDRNLIDMNNYGCHFIITSRGCPFNCFFCKPLTRKMFGSIIRRRTVKNVTEEMDFLNKMDGSKEFYFQDDTFTYDKNWIREFCEYIKNRGYKWVCNTRVDMVDDEILSLMRKSGCKSIHYGVESGSQRILDLMRKGITTKQIKKAINLTHKNRIFASMFLMIGFPTETKNDLKKTIEIVKETHPDGIRISITTPILGSDLYTYCAERNISNIKNYDDYDYCDNDYPIKLEHLKKEDLNNAKIKILESYKHGLVKNIPKYLVMLPDNLNLVSSFFKSMNRNKIEKFRS